MLEAGVLPGPLLSEAGALLARAHVPDARREALRIWADLAGVSPGQALLGRGEAVSPGQAEAYLRALDRRAGGEPLAYVTGKAGFRRLELIVDARVLIPRPETEGLVELVLAQGVAGVVADIGTGSGCIALSLRQESAAQSVLGTDVSVHALEVARLNADRLGLEVRFDTGDLTAGMKSESLDVLVSNPPYIAAAEYEGLDASVREWEPRVALESGEDGLDATRRLLDDGRRVLRAGGLLALELDATRAALVAAMAVDYGWQHVTVHNDLYGRARYLAARRSNDS